MKALARTIALVGGSAVLFFCWRMYFNDHRKLPDALFLSIFGAMLLGGALMPDRERGGAGFDWDVGPYSSALKLLIIGLMIATATALGGTLAFLVTTAFFILAGAFRKPLRRIFSYGRHGDPVLRIDHLPATGGGKISGAIEVPGSTDALPGLQLTLICNVLTSAVVGNAAQRNRLIETTERWKASHSFPAHTDTDGARIAFAFDIPAGLPSPLRPGAAQLPDVLVIGKTYHEWQLLIEGAVERTFILPVHHDNP